MPHHACIDPQDPYGQAEAMVEFATVAGVVRLIAVHNAGDEDILPDLEDVERQALAREIRDDFGAVAPPGPLRRSRPITASHGERPA